jgi:hypothetical protein
MQNLPWERMRPQGAEVHLHNGGGHDGGILQDLIMESLVAVGWHNRACQQQLRLQLYNLLLEGSPVHSGSRRRDQQQ